MLVTVSCAVGSGARRTLLLRVPVPPRLTNAEAIELAAADLGDDVPDGESVTFWVDWEIGSSTTGS